MLAATISALIAPAEVSANNAEPQHDLVFATDPSSTVRAAGYGASVNLGPCTLFPSKIHPRTSRPGYIGPKPYTRCKVPVTSIHQDTELVHEWYAWWKKALEESGGNKKVRNYTQRTVEFKCRDAESTVWAGSTAGTVVYQGNTYYARVWQKPVRLACGG